MAELRPLPGGLKPLNMTCTSTDCENGLHYFRPKPRRGRKAAPMDTPAGRTPNSGGDEPTARGAADRRWRLPVPPRGPCRACGADLVDWNRVTRRDLIDAAKKLNAFTFEFLIILKNVITL